MCDKESSSHLVMSEIFDSRPTGTLFGTYNKAWGDGAILIYMYYGIELDKLEYIWQQSLQKKRIFPFDGSLR